MVIRLMAFQPARQHDVEQNDVPCLARGSRQRKPTNSRASLVSGCQEPLFPTRHRSRSTVAAVPGTSHRIRRRPARRHDRDRHNFQNQNPDTMAKRFYRMGDLHTRVITGNSIQESHDVQQDIQWAWRKVFQVDWRFRSGAGSMPCVLRILPTVLSETGCPGFASAPWMRSQPQLGFSFAIRRTS